MKEIVMALVVVLLAAGLTTCTDRSAGPNSMNVKATLYQSGGWDSPGVLSEIEPSGSCFKYKFVDTLLVEFCLTGNCCPDSNRFSLTHEIRGDTIFVTSADTARNLYRCFCRYVIHAEFENLELNRYRFICARSDEGGRVYYVESVSRFGY